LLEDLTATHEALGDWPIPSTVEQSDRIIDAHARFHAHWWDDARLGESVGAFLDTSGALNRWPALPRTSRPSWIVSATA
jgi:hypothetical protein